MDKKAIGSRIFDERKRLGHKTALSFSDKLAIPNNTYSGWEAGRTLPKADDLASMVAEGLDAHYVLTGERVSGYAMPGEDQVRIMVMDDEPSAGSGTLTDGHAMVRGFLDVQQDWAAEFLGSRVRDMRLMFAKGNSMSPTIWGGDPVFVDTSVRHFDGEGIYVFDFMGKLLIKRLRVDMVRQVVQVCSDNDGEYPMQEVSRSDLDQLHICGRVHTWLNVRRA